MLLLLQLLLQLLPYSYWRHYTMLHELLGQQLIRWASLRQQMRLRGLLSAAAAATAHQLQLLTGGHAG
jgi:hypothetical protein